MYPLKNYTKAFKYVWDEITVEIPLDADVEKTKDILYDIVGENEMAEGKLTLKNMTTGEQSLLTSDELLKTVRG